MAQALRKRYPFLAPELRIDNLVIGAGCIGLSVARALSRLHDRTTFLVERNEYAGQETSSRNSEVVHAGLYYGLNSLKTKLCCLGRPKLYAYCEQKSIAHRKTGKLIVATSAQQQAHLSNLREYCASIPKSSGGPVPLQYLTGEEARNLEPNLSEDTAGAVFSPETGIVDSHGLMEALESDITSTGQGELVYGTRVVRIDRAEGSGDSKKGDGSEEGWVVQTVSEGSETPTAVLAKCVVNAAGLNAANVFNQILAPSQQRNLNYCKGSYFSYKGPGMEHVKHLIYPCPQPNFAGLGTHLTMSLKGDIRFGPDVEWLHPPNEAEADWWSTQLNVDEGRLDSIYEAVRTYLPGVERNGFAVDYAGIRPKLNKEGEAAADFEIVHAAPGFINLLGLESPGLTSCLAIADEVEGLVKREVYGLGKGSGRTVSEVGNMNLDDWA